MLRAFNEASKAIFFERWESDFKLKFCTSTNSNMQNSMVVFTFSVFDRTYSSWLAKFWSENQMVSLSWNFVPTLIWIRRIKWWWVFFCFQLEVSFVGGNVFPKIKLRCWNLKLEPRLFQICRIRWWFSFFFLF